MPWWLVAAWPWVIWVIWVIVFNCMAGASGWLALGHLGHCFLRDLNDLKSMALARALGFGLWVIWVILSRYKNRWPETCQRGVTVI